MTTVFPYCEPSFGEYDRWGHLTEYEANMDADGEIVPDGLQCKHCGSFRFFVAIGVDKTAIKCGQCDAPAEVVSG